MAGRKQLDIKPKQVEQMASWGVPASDMANYFGCSPESITVKFKDSLIKGKENLKMKLRRKQIQVALSGNVSMLIWLGKNYLGQVDKPEDDGEQPDKLIIKLPVEFGN